MTINFRNILIQELTHAGLSWFGYLFKWVGLKLTYFNLDSYFFQSFDNLFYRLFELLYN